jgi:general secretion pathway protein K
MRTRGKTERGIALLATMMGIALMIIIVMDFTSSAMLGYRAAANQANELRAAYLARSGVNVGLALLAQHSRAQADQSDQQVEALNQEWSMPYPPIPVGGGTASVSIVDEERKLNINYLVNPDGSQNAQFEPVLERLFVTIGVSIDLIPAIIDWLDPDSVTDGPTGAEADYYMRLVPPYAPRNGPMPSIGDLRMIRGVDDQIFMKLSRVLTAFSFTPAPTTDNVLPQVNMYTAPPEVLVALDPDLAASPSVLDQFLAARMESQSTAPPQGIAGIGGASFISRSNLFTIEGRGSYAGARKLVFATVIHPNGSGPSQILQWHED